MIRILNAEPLGYDGEARAILARLGELTEAELDRDGLLAALPRYDVLIVRLAHQIDREVIGRGHCLKVIVTATTGLDHIDVDYARSKGVAVLSLGRETQFLRTVNATAEHTWALLLVLLRRIPQAVLAVRDGRWDRDAFRGRELDGKRLGVVGLGRIGRRVAGYGLAFGMRLAAYDPYAVEWLDGVTRLPELGALLRRSDVLSLHVPLDGQTQGMIGANELARMPSGSVLVNTSRGQLLDEGALLEALESDQLAGAALDVIAREREPEKRAESALLAYARTHDHLVITPHLGGATHESMARTELLTACKLAAFLGDGKGRNGETDPGVSQTAT